MSTLRTRIVAFLLAVSMLAGYALPAAAEEVQPGVEIAAEVEPTAAPDPEPQPEPAQEPAPEPQPEPAGETPTEAPTEPTTVTTEPENTEPETTEPQETQAPETTEPEETESEVTEPEETEPEETEPEETEPELAYPDATIYYAAPVEEHLVYGMNIVYPGTYDGCWDFPINSVTAVRYGGTLYATMHVGVAAAYHYLYFGSKAELEARLAQGGPFPVADAVRNNGELLFHFTTGAADNSRLTLCLVAVDGSQALGYQVEERELTIPTVPEEAIALFAAPHVTTSEITAGSYAAAPEGTQEQEAPGLLVAKEGEAYSEFKVTSATALAVDETIYITLRVAPQEDKTYAYSYLYLDDEDSLVDLMENDADITAVQGVENNEDQENPAQVYHFTLSADKLKDTRRVPVCLLKGDLTEDDAYVALELIVPDQLPTPAPAPADDVPEQEDEPEEQDQENQGEQEQEGEPEEQEQEEPKVIAVAKAAQYDAAPVAEKDITGLSVVDGEGAALNGFTVVSATGINANGQLYLTLQVTPAAENPYIYLFLGDKTALDAKLATEGEFSVVGCDTVEGTQSYHFTLSAAQAVSPVSVCLLKADLSYTEAKLTLPEGIPTWTTPKPTAGKYATSPFAEQEVSGELYVVKASDGTAYPNFETVEATAAIDGTQIYVTLYVAPTTGTTNKFTYSYLYLGSKAELETQLATGGSFDVVKGNNSGTSLSDRRVKRQTYHFTLPADQLGQSVPVSILKSDLNAEEAYNTEELKLIIPSSLPTETTFNAVSYPAAPVKEQDVKGIFLTNPAKPNNDGSLANYGPFTIKAATAVKDSKNIYVTLSVAASDTKGNFNYPYMYIGTLASLKAHLKNGGPLTVAQEQGKVTVGSDLCQVYHLVIPIANAVNSTTEGTHYPVCILKKALTENSPYNSSEVVLVIPDNVPEVPVPTAKTYAASPFPEQEVSGELYVVKASDGTAYPNFETVEATAAIDGTQIYVTLYVAPTTGTTNKFTYSYLYLGSKAELETQLATGGSFDVVKGNNSGTSLSDRRVKRQTYHFTLPADQLGQSVPVSILKSDLNAEEAYNTEELKLIIPSSLPTETTFNAVSYPAAPVKEQDVKGIFLTNPAKPNNDGSLANYGPFTIKAATAVKDSKNIYVTLSVAASDTKGNFNYPYMYIGTLASLKAHLKNGGPLTVAQEQGKVTVGSDLCQVYHLVIPIANAVNSTTEGTHYPVCILKKALTENSPYNSSEVVLVIPDNIPEAVVPTPVYVTSPAEEGEITGLSVTVKETNEAYSNFLIASATGLKANGKLYITALVNPDDEGKFAYDYLYFGTRTELEEQLAKGGTFDVIGGVVNGEKQNYHFVLTADQAGSSIPVCLVKKDLTYNEVELVLTVPEDIPAGAAIPAPAIPALPDTLSEAGIKVIKATDSKEFGMFAAKKTGMVIAGDKLLVHFETANKSYDRLYFGVKEDDLKSPYVQGTARADGSWVFEFELPASYRGTDNPICLGEPDGTWYTGKDLLISIPADTGDVAEVLEDANIQICPAGQYSQTGFAVSASSAILLGDNVHITITGKMTGRNAGKVADKLYLGSRSDRTKEPYVTGTVNSDGTTTFSFSVSADKLGTSILVVAGFNDGTWDTSNVDYFLNVPSFGKDFDVSYYTDGVYDLYGNAYLYQDKVARRSQPIDAGSTLTVSGDQVTIKWITRSTDADKLYIGSLTDDLATREAGAIASAPCDEADRTDYRVFTITMPKSMLSNQIPIVRHSTKWYQGTNGWLEEGGQDYLVLANRLPRISDLSDDTGTTIEDAGMKMLSGGSEVEQMFIITASSATLKGDTITCTITGTPYAAANNGSAIKLYLGSRDDADKTPYYEGTVDSDGNTTFTFTVPADKQGTSIRAVVSFEKTGWHTVQDYFLNITDFGTTFDLSYYTDGVYEIYGNARATGKYVPVDAESTLSVSGDKIVIKWVCRSKSFDKLYFGSVSDDETAKDAGAVEIKDYASISGYRVYTITLPKSALAKEMPVVYHKSSGWETVQGYLVLANRLPKLSDTPDIPVDPTDPTDPTDPSEEVKDGTYNTTGETGASMFKVVKAVLDANSGKYKVTLTLSGEAYDYLCLGTAADAPANKSQWIPAKVVNCTIDGTTKDWYTYTFEVEDPTKPIVLASHSKNRDQWYDRTVTLSLDGMKRTSQDGYYQVTTSCDASMFKIIDAKLKTVNGQMMAELTLSGTGYDYLYAGTGEQAKNDKANWVPFTKNAEGKYVYTVPVSALDEPIIIASHSQRQDIWYDRSVTFNSSSLKKIGDVDPTDPTDPTTPTDPTDPTNPTDPTTPTSPSELDTNGSTSAVNSSTTLKDGEYKPDGFTFSGGTGKTRIVCDKVVVKGGKSFAVIHFESTTGNPSAYKYVKASGNVYYPTADGKFTIPVTLNANNRILAMTTKMSAAHEIEYTIYVQLKKAQSTTSTGGGGSLSTEEEEKDDPNSKLDKTAPEILGLEFKENIKTSGARYLKLFQYDQGVVLAEVDLRRDTVLDTDEAVQALAQADKEAKEASQSQTVQSDEPADTAQITSDYVAAQYQGDILKYLLVPAGVDLPAGLEKDYLIVSIPASNVYLMDETLADTLDQLGALKNVSVLPEDCEDAELYDMLETGEKLPGGTWEKPDYRTIIKEKVALGLIGTEPLPLSEKALTERKETVPEREELTAVEYRDRLTKLTDRFAVLDIPLVVDRSADEPEAKGQAAWLKLYGILFGKQDAANKLYDAAIAKEDKA